MTRGCFGDLGGVRSCWGYRLKVVGDRHESEDTIPINVRLFSLRELKMATNNFSTKMVVGEGGFSTLYKGTLENGSVVAVKVLMNRKGGLYRNQSKDLDFVKQVEMMSRIRHRNVIGFIGCCVESDRRLIVYEFVEGRSLALLLFDLDGNNVELSWAMRASICLGVARGLEYLHKGINPSVVHRNIKPSNVLLEQNFNPKIVDFEIADFLDGDAPTYSGIISGTYGYMDPEFVVTGQFTEKADVYGFGILILEVITGRNIAQLLGDGRGTTLVDWVWELRESDRVMEVLDPRLHDVPEDGVTRFINVALLCVQVSADLRPSMTEVLLMLSGGYDFSRKVLKKPEHSQWSSTYYEVDSLVHDKSGEMEITAATSDAIPSKYGKDQEFIAASESFKRPPSDPVAVTKGKIIRVDEVEVESDLDTDSNGADIMQMSHDLETELYISIEAKFSVSRKNSPVTSGEGVPPHKGGRSDQAQATVFQKCRSSQSCKTTNGGSLKSSFVPSESGPSDKTGVEPEMMSTSEAKVAVEAAEQMRTSHDIIESELYRSTDPDMHVSVSLSGPSLVTSMVTDTSAQTQIFTHKEAVEGLPSQAEARQRGEVLSLPKVNTDRPIHCTVDKILEAFRVDKSRTICVHGRAGSGKTTVLQFLKHHPAVKYLFDQVICVTVPRLAHRQKIQNEIIQQLSLNVQYCKAEDEIAAVIHRVLTGRKVLFLLDDVWEIINLHEVGVPNPGLGTSCWLVLATRSMAMCDILAERKIDMEVLSNDESWELFCHQVGKVVDAPKIEPYARAITKECHGLPLIVSAVGSALRLESSVDEWDLALKSFQYSDESSTENQYPLSPQIKYCYNRLKAHDVKTCFLYCALFPRDKEIDISLLVDCFVNEGLLGGRTVAAYRKGHDIVHHLVKSSLLEVSDNGLVVEMHNVIRDSALAILSSSKEGYEVMARSHLSQSSVSESEQDASDILLSKTPKYLTRAGCKLKESPSLEEWEQATVISLMDNGLSTLPSKPNCPNLVALCLQRNSCLRVIPASFFDSMCSLRILNLSKTRIKYLPDSVSKLKNLQVLLLHGCERLLMLPSSIGLLKSLEVLDFQGTELSHLPDTVGELASLKQLRVSFYGSINHSEYTKLPAKLIPDGIISTLELRELAIFVHPGDQRWALSASDIIKEVENVKLSALSFHFPEVELLKLFLDKNQSWINDSLTMFNFIVGHDFKRIVSQITHDAELTYSQEQRCLRFVNGENIPDAVVKTLKRVTSFYLDHHLSICDLLEFGIDSMHNLKLCILRDCPELLAIVHVRTPLSILPFLDYLSISHLWNLKRIWVGHVVTGSFARLRYLSVHACPKLRYVLTCSMLEVLLNLEELIIEDCESLEHVVIEDEKVLNDDATNKLVHMTVLAGDQIVDYTFPVLGRLKELKLHYLPELSGIWRGRWPPLEYISFYNCPKLKNLHMEANDAFDIKEIAADKPWWDTLDWDDTVVSRMLQDRVSEICIDDL